MIQLRPPLVRGSVVGVHGKRALAGHVVANYASFQPSTGRDVLQPVAEEVSKVVDGVTSQIDRVDVFGVARWGRRRLSQAIEAASGSAPAAAALRFAGDSARITLSRRSWHDAGGVGCTAEVTALHTDLSPWLWAFLDAAARLLDAHSATEAPPGIEWERARLHLIFGECDRATEATRRGISQLRPPTALPRRTVAQGRRLVKQLHEFRDCRETANALRAALGGGPPRTG